MTRGLIWLASYPKSGNTWMRAFLANLTNEDQKEPVEINDFATGAIASSRRWFDAVTGYDSADLSHEEIDMLRPAVYRWSAQQQEESSFHKVHDAWTRLPNGSPLFPVADIHACLYIVRNPLDVVVSASHHNQTSIATAIKQMAWPEMSFCADTKSLNTQLRQKLLTWSEHVESWCEAPGINLRIVRYEDMLFNPLPTFTTVADFLEIEQGNVEQAIVDSSMETMQKMEQQTSFKERPQGTAKFFRKGIAGDWQQRLRSDQVAQMVHDHGPIMRRLGYLDDKDIPLVEPVEPDSSLPMLLHSG